MQWLTKVPAYNDDMMFNDEFIALTMITAQNVPSNQTIDIDIKIALLTFELIHDRAKAQGLKTHNLTYLKCMLTKGGQ